MSRLIPNPGALLQEELPAVAPSASGGAAGGGGRGRRGHRDGKPGRRSGALAAEAAAGVPVAASHMHRR